MSYTLSRLYLVGYVMDRVILALVISKFFFMNLDWQNPYVYGSGHTVLKASFGCVV